MGAIRVVSPEEFAGRVLDLLGNSRLTASALSKRMGRRRGYVSWLTNTIADNAPTRVDPEVAASVANALAGEGQLIEDELVLFNFLIGIRNDLRECIRPSEGVSSTVLAHKA